MFITDIEISQYHYCPKTMRHMANVSLTLKNQVVSLFCQLDLPAHVNNANRAAAFVGEATRQLRRMPEYRSGQQSLEVSAVLNAGLTLQAASA